MTTGSVSTHIEQRYFAARDWPVVAGRKTIITDLGPRVPFGRKTASKTQLIIGELEVQTGDIRHINPFTLQPETITGTWPTISGAEVVDEVEIAVGSTSAEWILFDHRRDQWIGAYLTKRTPIGPNGLALPSEFRTVLAINGQVVDEFPTDLHLSITKNSLYYLSVHAGHHEDLGSYFTVTSYKFRTPPTATTPGVYVVGRDIPGGNPNSTTPVAFLRSYKSDGSLLWESPPGFHTCTHSSDRFMLAMGNPYPDSLAGLPESEILEEYPGTGEIIAPNDQKFYSSAGWLIAPDGSIAVPCRTDNILRYGSGALDIARNTRLLSRSAPFAEFEGTATNI